MKKILLGFLLFLVLVLAFYSWWRLKDRHPGYWIDQTTVQTEAGSFSAGFATASINPTYFEPWNDANDDARYREEDGDSFKDLNDNGVFDAIWIAGFHNRRPAMGIHDTLSARAMVLEQGEIKMGICVIDAIGFGSDDIIDIRNDVQDELDLDYLIISSTHSHETPDLIGMWGSSEFKSGVNPGYLRHVKEQCAAAVREAEANSEPAFFQYGEDVESAIMLVEDSRRPVVLDPAVRLMYFTSQIDGKALGSLVGWSNHPETLWSDNLLLSADFPHFFRKSVEEGLTYADSVELKGLGGTCIFLNGAIGGLMTTSPRMEIPDISLDTAYLEPTFDKTRAQGQHLARIALELAEQNLDTVTHASLSLTARSIELPMSNKLFRLGAFVGVLDRGMSGWFKMRSEIAYWQLGEVGFLHVPGEIYPELINGGIEAPPGQDFDLAPVEIPPIREILPGSHHFVVGLSNDMIGYIIPKSEWDVDPPYLYHEHDSPYGEINSLGPETAPLLHKGILEMIEDLEVKK